MGRAVPPAVSILSVKVIHEFISIVPYILSIVGTSFL